MMPVIQCTAVAPNKAKKKKKREHHQGEKRSRNECFGAIFFQMTLHQQLSLSLSCIERGRDMNSPTEDMVTTPALSTPAGCGYVTSRVRRGGVQAEGGGGIRLFVVEPMFFGSIFGCGRFPERGRACSWPRGTQISEVSSETIQRSYQQPWLFLASFWVLPALVV